MRYQDRDNIFSPPTLDAPASEHERYRSGLMSYRMNHFIADVQYQVGSTVLLVVAAGGCLLVIFAFVFLAAIVKVILGLA